jgi:hypothetical protein
LEIKHFLQIIIYKNRYFLEYILYKWSIKVLVLILNCISYYRFNFVYNLYITKFKY